MDLAVKLGKGVNEWNSILGSDPHCRGMHSHRSYFRYHNVSFSWYNPITMDVPELLSIFEFSL